MKKPRKLPSEYVISLRDISKKFVIPHEKVTTLKGAFIQLFRKNSYESFYALKDVSFEVRKGECFGIVGKNGSGKSTLLKILAGVYYPDSGDVSIGARVSPFLELGIGFNPELSGRDNIYLNATVLGMSKKMIDAKFDSIVGFSEIGRFIDQKLKNYSSGMQVRLAFSVAIHANRDILLLDEVLAVGDVNFQRKCINQFERYKKEGKTIILVTHDTQIVQKYCDRAMLLDKGSVVDVGDPSVVIMKYQELNMSEEDKRLREELRKKDEEEKAKTEQKMLEKQEEVPVVPEEETHKEKPLIIKTRVSVISCRVYNHLGLESFSLETGKKFRVALRCRFLEHSKNVVFGVMLKNGLGEEALGLHSLYSRNPLEVQEIPRDSIVEVSFDGEMLLTQGMYTLYIGIADNVEYPHYDLIYSEETPLTVQVFGNDILWGPANSTHTTEVRFLSDKEIS